MQNAAIHAHKTRAVEVVPHSPSTLVTESIRRAIDGVDRGTVLAQYAAQNELFVVERMFPDPLIAKLAEGAHGLAPLVQRKYLPGYKKSGSVGSHTLQQHVPEVASLYRDPSLIEFLSSICGVNLTTCPESDPHACALYYYSEPGDHIGYHYDTSHYNGSRFTVLVGLVENSSSRLMCQLFKDDPAKQTQELAVQTLPGTLVFFNGDKLYHAVSPLGHSEERIVLTMEYVTDPTMTPFRRALSNVKDAIAYFGFRELLNAKSRTA